ncbi:uncharacterized protein LOC142471679 [Ascaphus truei]|uniref:uncharacterized protein LOC142471679 n=1 Tax=Ascaphus truei TaxID=8439 RepID=UPI003F5A95FD
MKGKKKILPREKEEISLRPSEEDAILEIILDPLTLPSKRNAICRYLQDSIFNKDGNITFKRWKELVPGLMRVVSLRMQDNKIPCIHLLTEILKGAKHDGENIKISILPEIICCLGREDPAVNEELVHTLQECMKLRQAKLSQKQLKCLIKNGIESIDKGLIKTIILLLPKILKEELRGLHFYKLVQSLVEKFKPGRCQEIATLAASAIIFLNHYIETERFNRYLSTLPIILKYFYCKSMKVHASCADTVTANSCSVIEEQLMSLKRAALANDTCNSKQCEISGSRANSQARPYPHKQPHQDVLSRGGTSLQGKQSEVKNGIRARHRLAQNNIRKDPLGVHAETNTISKIGSDTGMDLNTNNKKNISLKKTHPGALEKLTGNQTSFVIQPEQPYARVDKHRQIKYNTGKEKPKYVTVTSDPPSKIAGSVLRENKGKDVNTSRPLPSISRAANSFQRTSATKCTDGAKIGLRKKDRQLRGSQDQQRPP